MTLYTDLRYCGSCLLFALAFVWQASTAGATTYNVTRFGPFGSLSNNDFYSSPQPAINNNGTVFLPPSLTRGVNDSGTKMYVAGNYPFSSLVTKAIDGTVTTIATESQFPGGFPVASLGNDGSVVFGGADSPFAGPTGIYRSVGVNITTIADNSGPFDSFGAPTINSHGVIAFVGYLDTSPNFGGGVYISSGGVIQTLYDTSGPFSGFREAAINDVGEVAFLATLDAGGSGIFRGTGGIYTQITSYWNGGQSISMNNHGDVLFADSNDVFHNSLHVVDANLTDHLVLSIGDRLFGSTVKAIRWVTMGQLNDWGQVVFQFALADGRTGSALATPVPEPSSLALAAFGFASLVVFVWRGMAPRKPCRSRSPSSRPVQKVCQSGWDIYRAKLCVIHRC